MAKLPGGMQTKVFLGTSIILAATGYHVFYSSGKEGGRQGEHMFSQEKPEVVVRSQELQRQRYREQQQQAAAAAAAAANNNNNNNGKS